LPKAKAGAAILKKFELGDSAMRDMKQHYINGQWVASIDGREMAVEDPSTEEKIATITLGGVADADAAVAAAKAAFAGWAVTGPEARVAALERLMDIYKERAGEMAQAISHEMGAPIALAKTAQVGAGAGHLKNTIRTAKGFAFERPLGDHAPGDMILYEPVGVCALITPWNWPMNQVMLKVAPALAAGCTMVLKPAEQAPLSAMLLAEMIDAAGFPPGVFNLVNGDGAGVGAHLTAHPDVDMVSFTGSTRAGVAISKAAADTVKRVSLELGGKGANIIFADADEKAVTRGVRTASTIPASPATRRPGCSWSARSTTRLLKPPVLWPRKQRPDRRTSKAVRSARSSLRFSSTGFNITSSKESMNVPGSSPAEWENRTD
jgi:aldehyde dehydrogenase (NAD+)